MAEDRTTTITITRNTIRSRNLIYFFIMMANFMYVLVLFLISSNPGQGTGTNTGKNVITLEDMFLIIVVLILLGLVLIHGIFLPKAQKIAEPFNRFPIHLIIIILGIESPSMYGLILGFISLDQTNSINWLYVGLPIVWSFIYGVFFYLFYFQPTLDEIEVCKEITRTLRGRRKR